MYRHLRWRYMMIHDDTACIGICHARQTRTRAGQTRVQHCSKAPITNAPILRVCTNAPTAPVLEPCSSTGAEESRGVESHATRLLARASLHATCTTCPCMQHDSRATEGRKHGMATFK